MQEIIQIASNYGALGLVLLACFWYINKKDTEFKEERDQRALTFETMHKDALTSIDNNTKVLTEISTIIKNK